MVGHLEYEKQKGDPLLKPWLLLKLTMENNYFLQILKAGKQRLKGRSGKMVFIMGKIMMRTIIH